MIGLMRKRRLERAGSTAVEFALIALPLMTLLFGIIEFGRYLWYQQTLEGAVATASQYVYANSTLSIATIKSGIPAKVQASLTGLDPTKATVTTSVPTTDANGVTFITITVTYPFTYLTIVGVTPLSNTLSASATVPVQ